MWYDYTTYVFVHIHCCIPNKKLNYYVLMIISNGHRGFSMPTLKCIDYSTYLIRKTEIQLFALYLNLYPTGIKILNS